MPIIGADLDDLVGHWVVDLDSGVLLRVTGFIKKEVSGAGVLIGYDLKNQRVNSRSVSVLDEFVDRWLSAHFGVVDHSQTR